MRAAISASHQRGGLFRSCGRMTDRRIFILLWPPDIVQQAGGDEQAAVHPALAACNIQCCIQYPVDVLLIMGAVGHAGKHIVLQPRIV